MLGEQALNGAGAGAMQPGAGHALAPWHPIMSGMELPLCSLYYLTTYFQHQQQYQAVAVAAAAGIPPQHSLEMEIKPLIPAVAKRRKTTTNSSLAQQQDFVESANLLSKRGPVTFKPYTDDARSARLGNASCSGRGHRVDGCRPLKRKLGQSAPIVYSRNGETKKKLVLGEEEQDRAGCTTVDNLFPEVLTDIFKYLDVTSKGRAARVCSRWRDATYRKCCWTGIEAKLHLGRSNPHLFPSLVRRGIHKVQVLSLRRSLRELMNGIPNLESLNLSGCYNLSDQALDGAFNKDLPYLKRLNLSLCKDVSDNSLGRIATHCKNLKELNLGGCCKVTNTGLLLVSWGLKHIEVLNLRSCRQISDNGIAHLAGITENQSVASSKGSKTLRELGLQDCQKLTDESLRHLADGLPHMEKVNLSFCVSVTDTGLKYLSSLLALRHLNLRSCDNVSDIGVGYLAENGSQLQSLDVSFCNNVADPGVKHIAAGMVKIRSLSMTTCGVSDEGLKRLSESLNDLEELYIGQCMSVTDKGLSCLADKLKKLQVLDLYGCTKVTQTSLRKIKLLPVMKRLNLEL